jgi:aspartate aminotransferase
VPPDDHFLPDFDALESTIGPRTRIVLVNSPNNPTGVVYGADVLARLAEIIRRKEAELDSEIFLVSDEPYRRILFDGMEFPHIFDHHDRSIVATSHSKDLALPGERIGFVAVSPRCNDADELVEGLTFCNRTLGFVNAPALMQQIVRHLQYTTVDVLQYQDKRDLLHGTLTDIGYSVVRPQGAFYMFPRAPTEDDVAFVDALRERRVLVVPGRGFGAPGHFRIAYCVEDATLKGALEGFRAAFEQFAA